MTTIKSFEETVAWASNENQKIAGRKLTSDSGISSTYLIIGCFIIFVLVLLLLLLISKDGSNDEDGEKGNKKRGKGGDKVNMDDIDALELMKEEYTFESVNDSDDGNDDEEMEEGDDDEGDDDGEMEEEDIEEDGNK